MKILQFRYADYKRFHQNSKSSFDLMIYYCANCWRNKL